MAKQPTPASGAANMADLRGQVSRSSPVPAVAWDAAWRLGWLTPVRPCSRRVARSSRPTSKQYGAILVAAAVAEEYGITEVDGRRPRPLTLADV